MPMERSRYPKDWEAIALQVKQAANWKCQHCDRPCRMPKEQLAEFVLRIQGTTHPDLDWVNQTAVSAIAEHPQRFTLTVAHLDQNPANNVSSNLRALCSVCHLRHDRPFRVQNRHAKLERKGQINLLTPPAGHGKDLSKVQPTIFGGDT